MPPNKEEEGTDRDDEHAGSERTLGAHGARITNLEAQVSLLRTETRQHLGNQDLHLANQDKTLAQIVDLISRARGGIAVLGAIGAFAAGIFTFIRALPTIIDWLKGKYP